MRGLVWTYWLVVLLGVVGCTWYVPVQLTPSTSPLADGSVLSLETVEGRACVSRFLIFRWGNNSLHEAKAAALRAAQTTNIADVSVDIEETVVLPFLIVKVCTIVRGRPVLPQPNDRAQPASEAEEVGTPATARPVPPVKQECNQPAFPADKLGWPQVVCAINSKRVEIQRCAEPYGKGKSSFVVKVDPDGTVVSVVAESESPLQACLAQVLRGIAFPKTTFGDEVVVPLSF